LDDSSEATAAIATSRTAITVFEMRGISKLQAANVSLYSALASMCAQSEEDGSLPLTAPKTQLSVDGQT
jgi:hypothetical protein